ncbi:MAG: amidase, partial [Hyphomicrobiaceae bacterium]
MMSDQELQNLTLSEASERIARRDLSPSVYTEALIARSQALQLQLFAFITPTFEAALDAARVAEEEIAAGGHRSALHGIPFAVKDIYDTAGILTTGHSKTNQDRVPDKDSTAVARLKRSGAILTGKLSTHEFAHGGPSFDLPWPPARNPWNTAHFTGGSSSGSAAAVAAGLVPFALGSDTGGSIRSPAGLCGLAGFKPTYGRVSRAGVIPNSYTYDHCGPLARTARDCALVMTAMAGFDPLDPASSRAPGEDFSAQLGRGLAGVRIGVVRHFWEQDARVHNELPAAIDNAIAALRDLGAVVENVELRPLQYYSDVKIVAAESEVLSINLQELAKRPQDFGQDFRARCLPACLFTAEDYVRAGRERSAILKEMRELYRQFDLFVTANTSAAPRIDNHDPSSFFRSPSFTTPFNCTGGPALALPCGLTSDGLPLSFQIAGRPFDDARVLAAGDAFERATGYWKQRPPISEGAALAPIDAQPWRPDISQVPDELRQRAIAAASYHGLNLPPDILDEL